MTQVPSNASFTTAIKERANHLNFQCHLINHSCVIIDYTVDALMWTTVNDRTLRSRCQHSQSLPSKSNKKRIENIFIMHKFLVFFACFSLQTLAGSGSPLTNALESNGGDKYYAGLQPYATDFGPGITESINNLLATLLSNPLHLIYPNGPIAPLELPLATISNGVLTGWLNITEIWLDASSAHVNETRAVLDGIIAGIDVYLGLPVPKIQLSGTLVLDASVAGIKIKATDGFKISVEDLFFGIIDTKLKVIGGCAFTTLDYQLELGALLIALDNVKIAGLDATTLFNELANQIIAVQLLPYLRNTLEPANHQAIIDNLLKPIMNSLPSTLVPTLCKPSPRELPQIASEMLKKFTSL